MGIAVARRVRTSAGCAHRAGNRRHQPWPREQYVTPSSRLVRAASWWPHERVSPWDRLKDDRECIPFKVILLSSLLLLAAMLQWVA